MIERRQSCQPHRLVNSTRHGGGSPLPQIEAATGKDVAQGREVHLLRAEGVGHPLAQARGQHIEEHAGEVDVLVKTALGEVKLLHIVLDLARPLGTIRQCAEIRAKRGAEVSAALAPAGR